MNSGQNMFFFEISNDSQVIIILNIICSALGGNYFNFPFIIKYLGLPLTLIIFTLIILSIYYTIVLLRSFTIDTMYFSFI